MEATDYKQVDYQGRFRSEEYQFCLKAPDEWDIRERLEGATVVALSPSEGPKDNFRESLVVTMEKLSDTPTAEEYRSRSLEALSQAEAPPEALEVGEDELPWARFVHAPAGERVKVLSFFTVHQVAGTPYGMVFAFTSNKVDDFEPWEAIFRSIADTFAFGLENCPEVVPTEATPGETPAADASPVAEETPPASPATPAVEATPAAEPTPRQEAPPTVSATPAPERTPEVTPTP